MTVMGWTPPSLYRILGAIGSVVVAKRRIFGWTVPGRSWRDGATTVSGHELTKACDQPGGRKPALYAIVLACAGLLVFGASLQTAAVQRPPTQFDQLEQEREVLGGHEHQLGDAFLVSLGGRLYDDLWAMSGEIPPGGRNPGYPSADGMSDADTWRCVTCHGWDYAGSGPETKNDRGEPGIRQPGLRHLDGASPPRMLELFSTAHPDYANDLVSGLPMELLLLFVSAGQYKRETFLPAGSVSDEQLKSGQDIYEGVCMSCHGPSGTGGLDGKPGLRQSLGWLARHRPERTLHKIINGVPGRSMVTLRFVEDDAIRVLMAYLRTLDPGN